MSTQITATQSNFSNQAAEFNIPSKKSLKEQTDIKSNKVNEESNVSQVQGAKIQERYLVEEAKLKDEDLANNTDDKLVIDEALEVISDFMQLSSRNINFQQDDGSDKTVIKFFDGESKELIKQFPSEEVLEIAQRIVALRQDVGEKTGIFLEEKV